MNIIGSVLYDLGKYDEALAQLQDAKGIYDRTVGINHPECKVTEHYIDLVKKRMGEQ